MQQIKEALRSRIVELQSHNESFRYGPSPDMCMPPRILMLAWSSVRVHPQLGNLGGALNDYPCGAETVMGTWLNVPSVMEVCFDWMVLLRQTLHLLCVCLHL